MRTHTTRLRSASGFTLIELLVTMAVMLIVMAGTMTALGDASRATEGATLTTNLNYGLRVAMDLIVRDLLQVGQGLPTGRIVTIPSGAGATPIRLPGPPGTTFTLPTTTTALTAVMPGPGLGPVINGVATDVITTLAVDSSFERRCLSALTATTMTVVPKSTNECGATLDDDTEDDVAPGDLIMLWKGSFSALVQVTSVSGQVITFGAGDSLNLNQIGSGTTDGTVSEYIPANGGEPLIGGRIQSVASRIRMITYYIDATTDPARPRLVRRLNAGHPTSYDNTLGTAVAFDVENLTFSYDLADENTNPTNVRMTPDDITGTGSPAPGCPCDPERIRKVNVLLAARARRPMRVSGEVFRNSLFTQVSLRSLAFVDRYE